ncbi:MaoC family dehydratase [Microbacterium sp. A94]|uniref:MaoC family dehydratase n=1 Tax=Microbacterium sp. A94 TaxID=3450717 RepID=UPI003F42FEBE
MTTFSSLGELRAAVGADLGTAGPITLSQERINGFADVTEDHQWIHIDAERAASSNFGTTIAHGYLTLALVAPFLEKLLVVEGVQATLNYGLDTVRFPTPVPSGSDVSATATLEEVIDKPGGAEVRVKMTMTIPSSTKPVCVATVVMRIVE